MLLSLSIKNFVLIDQLEVDFTEKLNVLSGETGAGKSIILDALALTLGERINSKQIKDESKSTVVASMFNIYEQKELKNFLETHGFSQDDNLIVKRVFDASGKSKSYVNDVICSLSFLEKIKEYLVEVSSQHDQKSLFDSSFHRAVLDEYGEHFKDIEKVQKAYDNLTASRIKADNLKELLKKAEEERNYLEHIINELEELDLKESEEEDLSKLRVTLREKSKIIEICTFVKNEIDGASGVVSKLGQILKYLTKQQEVFASAEKFFDVSLAEINEGIIEVEKIFNHFEQTDLDLNSIEERLFKLRSIARKYNVVPSELNSVLLDAKEKIKLIDNCGESIKLAERELVENKAKFIDLAKTLSDKRKVKAKQLEKIIKTELHDLKMPNAEMKILVEDLAEEDWNNLGIDSVKIIARTNPGSKFDAINKVASGGELSRIFLALKVALANVKKSSLIVFDEIDVGVGGAVADAIGRKLAKLSEHTQLIVITHQPQVAAYSNTHYVVEKIIKAKSTDVKLRRLDSDAKVIEIARMLSAESISDESIQAARQLIKNAA